MHNTDPGVVVVTGASRGLGFELVQQLALAGREVVACCRSVPQAALHRRVRRIALDVTDPASVTQMAAALAGRPVDLLINNAALRGATGGLARVEPEDFARVMATNVLAPLLVTRALLPNLRAGQGVVANISSRAGSMTEGRDPDGDYAYRCSKAALNMATVTLADETGLTVLSVHPGWIKTDMGGPEADLTTAASASAMLGWLALAGPADSGSFRTYDGIPVAW